MKLHLGCGVRNFGSDWTHIDAGEFEHVVHHDVTLQHFLPEQADVIYASHLLSYFSRQEAFPLLCCWYRVLKQGGILRLAVPDFEALSFAYETDFKLSDILGPLYGRMEMKVGDANEFIYHKTCYDYDSLHELLYKVGFININKYDWKQTDHADIDDQSQAYLPKMDKQNGLLISLNVEATK